MVKLSLGTAQFGMDYGITNTKGKVDSANIEKILNTQSIQMSILLIPPNLMEIVKLSLEAFLQY